MHSHAAAQESPDDAVPKLRGGALLGTGAVIIWNDIANEGRDQFYAWHDKEHIPERLAIPGFRRGRRYAKYGHSPEWLTLYEADDLDVLVSPGYLERLNSPTPATTDTIRYFRNTSRAVCEVVHSLGSSSGGHALALRLEIPDAQADALRAALCADLMPRAMALNGVVACHLFAADRRGSFVNTAESSTRAFDVPSWVLLAEATTTGAAGQAQALIAGPELQRLGATVRSDAATYTLEICRLASLSTDA